MNELTKIKDRILARIEMYIGDIELAEEKELTEDEKTIFESVKNIINEEFGEPTPDSPLPRFIVHEDGKLEQIKTSEEKEPTYYDVFRFKKMLVKEDREKFQKFLDEHERLRATEKQKLYLEAMKCTEAEQRRYENTIHFADAICRLSQTCGISHSEAKDIIEESIEMLKKLQTNTAKWVEAGIGIDCTGHRFKEYKCSKCGNIDLSHRKNKFCPECGRRMEG